MASLLDLFGRGAQLAEHGSTIAAREAEAAARAAELEARAARVAAAQKAESEAARLVELQRQLDVAQAAEQLRAQGRLNAASAPAAAPVQAAPAAAPVAPAATPAASAPAAQSRLGQVGGFLKDAVTGGWGNSLGEGLGEMLGGNAAVKSGLGGIGRLSHLSVTTPWALLGAGKLLEGAKNVSKGGWKTLGNELGVESSPEITHKDEDKRRKKLNTEVMGGLTDMNLTDNGDFYKRQDPAVYNAIEAIPDEDYKKALSRIARGGDAKEITNMIARNHVKKDDKWKPKGIVHLAGTIGSKGGQKFGLAINYDADQPEILHIPISDENNSHGGVHFGTTDEWDKKKSQSK